MFTFWPGNFLNDILPYFIAEDAYFYPCSACVDGRVFIRKINEGSDEEEKPQIFERILLALHIIADGESFHPRVCWHPHKQVIMDFDIHVIR
jgi:enhancer of mRNA-decapping protein 4